MLSECPPRRLESLSFKQATMYSKTSPLLASTSSAVSDHGQTVEKMQAGALIVVAFQKAQILAASLFFPLHRM